MSLFHIERVAFSSAAPSRDTTHVEKDFLHRMVCKRAIEVALRSSGTLWLG